MKQLTKLLLGLVTLWPFAYVIFFFFVMASLVFMPEAGNHGQPPLIALIFPLHLLTMVVTLALMIFYIVNVFRNNLVQNDKKVLWTVVLFMGGMIAMPIYWYLYIWKEAPVFNNRSPEQLVGGDSASSVNDVNVGREKEYVPREPPNWRE